MAFIPAYPILVGAFFVCFGIFRFFQSGRENNDTDTIRHATIWVPSCRSLRGIRACYIHLLPFGDETL